MKQLPSKQTATMLDLRENNLDVSIIETSIA